MVNMAEKSECFLFSPKAACYGVFAQYGFRFVLGELGRFREGTGIRELVPGSVSGTGFQEPEVLRRLRVPEIQFPRS